MIQGGDPTGTGRGGESVYGYANAQSIRAIAHFCVAINAVNLVLQWEV